MLDDGAPSWAKELASSYLRGASSVYLIHGNIHDLVPAGDSTFVSLETYLATELFGTRDVVLAFDRGSGIRFLAPGAEKRRAAMQEDFERTLSAADRGNRPKDPKLVFELLDRYILAKLRRGFEGGAAQEPRHRDPLPRDHHPRGRGLVAHVRARRPPDPGAQLGERSVDPIGRRDPVPPDRESLRAPPASRGEPFHLEGRDPAPGRSAKEALRAPGIEEGRERIGFDRARGERSHARRTRPGGVELVLAPRREEGAHRKAVPRPCGVRRAAARARPRGGRARGERAPRAGCRALPERPLRRASDGLPLLRRHRHRERPSPPPASREASAFPRWSSRTFGASG